jgi:hypothetical protein
MIRIRNADKSEQDIEGEKTVDELEKEEKR